MLAVRRAALVRRWTFPGLLGDDEFSRSNRYVEVAMIVDNGESWGMRTSESIVIVVDSFGPCIPSEGSAIKRINRPE